MFAHSTTGNSQVPECQDRWLFLDMNSFFASVEQQECPELRGRPVAVAPMLSDGTCVIAASYDAKPFGVKTGVNIGKARQMCPGLIVVAARPGIYIDYHRRMVATLREELPDPKTLSVDEMACKLWANENNAGDAVRLAIRLKERLRQTLGTEMLSSVGIAPNVFLAKVAADLYKPNGLTLIRPGDIPHALTGLVLRDLPGIGRKMHVRLHAANIHTVSQLYAATETELAAVWGGVVGRRWWHMLRGSTNADYGALSEPDPTTVGNSHVIEPALRTVSGAETIMIRLLAKAATRLRLKGQLASRLHLSVSFQNDRRRMQYYKAESGNVEAAGDLLTWLPVLRRMWAERPRLGIDYAPKKASVAFTKLTPATDISGYLFEEDDQRHRLTTLIDKINNHYKPTAGRHNAVDIASVYWLNRHAPERIAFRKITDDDREREPQSV